MRWCDYAATLLNKDVSQVISAIEYATRTCYRSHDKTTVGSGEKLIKNCIRSGHESVLEHQSLSFEIMCDRGTMAAINRHRHSSQSVESTRYCRYTQERFNGELTFVRSLNEEFNRAVEPFLRSVEAQYIKLLEEDPKYPTDLARAVLPNMLKTQMVLTMNIRALRHFLRLRGSAAAHEGIRELVRLMRKEIIQAGLGLFIEDIPFYEKSFF